MDPRFFFTAGTHLHRALVQEVHLLRDLALADDQLLLDEGLGLKHVDKHQNETLLGVVQERQGLDEVPRSEEAHFRLDGRGEAVQDLGLVKGLVLLPPQVWLIRFENVLPCYILSLANCV